MIRRGTSDSSDMRRDYYIHSLEKLSGRLLVVGMTDYSRIFVIFRTTGRF